MFDTRKRVDILEEQVNDIKESFNIGRYRAVSTGAIFIDRVLANVKVHLEPLQKRQIEEVIYGEKFLDKLIERIKAKQL